MEASEGCEGHTDPSLKPGLELWRDRSATPSREPTIDHTRALTWYNVVFEQNLVALQERSLAIRAYEYDNAGLQQQLLFVDWSTGDLLHKPPSPRSQTYSSPRSQTTAGGCSTPTRAR